MHIAEDSVENAIEWEVRLAKAIKKIGEMAGHAIDEEASERLGYSIRKSVFEKTYLIHYRINRKDRAVEILNFRHGMRLPKRGEP